MLTDTVQSWGGRMLGCWVQFPGKELDGATLSALGAKKCRTLFSLFCVFRKSRNLLWISFGQGKTGNDVDLLKRQSCDKVNFQKVGATCVYKDWQKQHISLALVRRDITTTHTLERVRGGSGFGNPGSEGELWRGLRDRSCDLPCRDAFCPQARSQGFRYRPHSPSSPPSPAPSSLWPDQMPEHSGSRDPSNAALL